ncbi:ABC transporter ATP-binding protein [Mesorhizobium sp. ES1-1]|uniref:ABC transporter ATP-binding protein n=1 Tax=Mesorhizobium sp. ES1-1 TaxID=2876629 RepID=UPI001CCB638A|nr:ABC transporter ATP-binding protein [Mesorhizobium sp. ES1-1]MBZ9678877.1 ABC transporter ATP-binding protein [Mesorhizobium sp. ES1-1]
MSGIEIRNLNKRWASFDAVKDVSFEVKPGSLTVLLGPSGCGKSTTLRLIAGLDAVTSGQISVGGKDITGQPPAKRGLAMVFQSYALFPHLSVAENIVFGLKVRRVPAGERARRLNKAVDILGLGTLLDRKPSQLSGGQQQRVALGRAIVAEASVCLMDEPLSNLDAQLRHEMRKEIRSIQQSLGMTMVYVTHDQIEAMSLADQVILMRGGRIEQKAEPATLYLRPATSFAARFIGTPPMNLVSLTDGPAGAIVKGSSGPALVEGNGDGLLLGLRPEEIRIEQDGVVPAVIRGIEYHGADSILECSIGDQLLQVRVEGIRRQSVGDQIRLGWLPEAMHVFDGADGNRIERRPMIGHAAAERALRLVP